jgi:hypothetical protein
LLQAIERARLAHDGLRQSDLPHVVQQRGVMQPPEIAVAIEKVPPDPHCKCGHTARVSSQGSVVPLDRVQQHIHHTLHESDAFLVAGHRPDLVCPH